MNIFILSQVYIFYADIYFIQNFVIKIAVIYLSMYANQVHMPLKTGKGIGKIVLAAFLGTIIEIIGLSMVSFIGMPYALFLLLTHAFEVPCMIRFVLRRGRQIKRVIITGYFFVMIINAVLELLWNWFGAYGRYLFLLCASCGGVYIGLCIYQNYGRMQKGIFPVELFHSGKTIFTYGFYDSGNRLKDPYTQKGVHIVSEKIVKQFSLELQKEVYVPYQALGKEQGLLKVYYLDGIKILKEQEIIEFEKVPVGEAEESLFQNKKHQMILNEEVW